MLKIDPLDIEAMEAAKNEFLLVLTLKYTMTKGGNCLFFRDIDGNLCFVMNGKAQLSRVTNHVKNSDPIMKIAHESWFEDACTSNNPIFRFFDYAAKKGILS